MARALIAALDKASLPKARHYASEVVDQPSLVA